MNTLLIYTDRTSNRLKYVFDLLVGDLLGLQYSFTQNRDSFKQHPGPKFSYANAPVADEIFFQSAELLFEAAIKHQPINFSEYKELRGFYPVADNSLIPFDMFASAFFMVTRYNEYLPSKMDKYGRYRASQSMNYRGGYLEEPMVNLYALELKNILAARYPQLVFKQHIFTYIPTFDIDIAYSYLGKGLKRSLGGFARSFLLSDFKDMRNRVRVLSGTKRDPYDSYDYILDTCGQYRLNSIFFFLLGDESSLDKNLEHTTPIYRKLISRIAEKTEVGIHLSFKSHIGSSYMEREIKRLEEIAGVKITRNRFHYLRFQIPTTYQRLLKLGITQDYSMGYGPHAGFRAGICTPYKFFNIKHDQETDLTIFPIAFMDTTFTTYYKSDAEFALEKIRGIMYNVQKCGGTMYGLWHNSSFIEEREWKGWKNVFETVASEASVLMKEARQSC